MRFILAFVMALPLSASSQEVEVIKSSGESVKGTIERITFKSDSLGEVKIDGKEVHRIYLAAFRPFDEKAQKEAELLIKQLGDDDTVKREDATEKLQKMGHSVLPLLQKHEKTNDSEVSSRIEGITALIKETKGRQYDTVVGKGFVLNGFITFISVDGKELDLKEVKLIKIGVMPEPAKGNVIYLADGSKVLGSFKKTIKLEKDKEFEPKDIENIVFEKDSVTVTSKNKEHKGIIKDNVEVETPFGSMILKVENLKSYKAHDKVSYISGMSFTGINKQGYEEYEHEKTGMIFVLIPAGTFKMGSEGQEYEKPVHKVTLSEFLISKYEVTQQVWQKIMEKNSSVFKGDKNPVETKSWEEAQEFCKKTDLRLPTEAEWEYACRAGTNTKFYWGDKEDGDYMWHKANSEGKTHPVGEKKPNGFGLHDMNGNVREWCQDWWNEEYYKTSPKENPKGPEKGKCRVLRGGSWSNDAFYCGSSDRDFGHLSLRYDLFGFRAAASVE